MKRRFCRLAYVMPDHGEIQAVFSNGDYLAKWVGIRAISYLTERNPEAADGLPEAKFISRNVRMT